MIKIDAFFCCATYSTDVIPLVWRPPFYTQPQKADGSEFSGVDGHDRAP